MRRKLMVIYAAVAVATLCNAALVGMFGGIGATIGRVLIAITGGWLVISRAHGSLWAAACVGPLVLLIDHVFIAGGSFVVRQAFERTLPQREVFRAFSVVLLSFATMAPFAAVCSWLPGVLARRLAQHGATHP
jgi:hypothetical protein